MTEEEKRAEAMKSKLYFTTDANVGNTFFIYLLDGCYSHYKQSSQKAENEDRISSEVCMLLPYKELARNITQLAGVD